MNYRHVYHAGSFTDVFKHIVLIALLESLMQKENPFCYIDTHAGTGIYDLFSIAAGKTEEYKTGIEKIIQSNNPPALIKKYLDCVHQINNKLLAAKYASLQYYPGSPLIARTFMRNTDQIIACELHPEEYQSLRETFKNDRQVAVHHTDGFQALKAFLPPKERRGLIFIDPPYENPDEFSHIVRALPSALKRFETGVYAIWYPIKEKIALDRFYRDLKEHVKNPIFTVELTCYPDIANHLNGSGVAIINPPWKFDKIISDVLPWLWKALSVNEQGDFIAAFQK